MRVLAALVITLALAGCPREIDAPPAAGDPCSATSDCNPPGQSCGELRLCVYDRCEEGHSLRIPCR